MGQGTNVMPCGLVNWVLLQGCRIPFSLHRSNWITLRPSPCPTYPTPLNISSHGHTYIYQTTWYLFQATVIFPLTVMRTSNLTNIMICGTWYKSQHCNTHTHTHNLWIYTKYHRSHQKYTWHNWRHNSEQSTVYEKVTTVKQQSSSCPYPCHEGIQKEARYGSTHLGYEGFKSWRSF